MHKMISLSSSPLLCQVVHEEVHLDISPLCRKVKGVFDFAEYGKEKKREQSIKRRVYELDNEDNHQKELKFDLKLDEFFDDSLIILVFLMEYCINFADIAEHKRHEEHKFLLWKEIHPQHIAHLMNNFSVPEFRAHLDLHVHVQRSVVSSGKQEGGQVDVEGLIVIEQEQGGYGEADCVEEHHRLLVYIIKDSEYNLNTAERRQPQEEREKEDGEDWEDHRGVEVRKCLKGIKDVNTYENGYYNEAIPSRILAISSLLSLQTNQNGHILISYFKQASNNSLQSIYPTIYIAFLLFKPSSSFFQSQLFYLFSRSRNPISLPPCPIHPKYSKNDIISTCYALFIDLDIYIVSKIGMQHRKLSQQQASRLFQTTFLLISQQNLAQKQRSLKNQGCLHSHSLQPSCLSPKKSLIGEVQHHPSPQLPLHRQINPQNSPERQLSKTSSKWSLEKSSSNSEGYDPLPPQGCDLERKESNSDDFSLQKPHGSTPHQNLLVPFITSIQPQSQMMEEGQENLFVESMIKDIKRDLEIRSKGKICKSQEINSKTGQVTGYYFYCKNDGACPFSCFLEYTGKRNLKNEKLYKLRVDCQGHSKACIQEEQEIVFMKLTKIIDQMQQPIHLLLSQNPDLKPKQILNIMAKRIGEQSHKFIYKGLGSKNYHKAAKKYFDNLIYKIKNQMGAI